MNVDNTHAFDYRHFVLNIFIHTICTLTGKKNSEMFSNCHFEGILSLAYSGIVVRLAANTNKESQKSVKFLLLPNEEKKKEALIAGMKRKILAPTLGISEYEVRT